MRRTVVGALAALTVVASALVVSSTPASAAGTLTPWSSSVAVGATVSVTASGCPRTETETDDGYSFQAAQLLLITGSGAGERMAAFGDAVSATRYRFRVPGWVDPDQPAVIAGQCVRTSYDFSTSDEETTTTLFTYADAAIDITPGTAVPPGPTMVLDRTTAAGGQVLRVTGAGCAGDSEFAQVVLFAGTDLSGRAAGDYLAGAGGAVGPGGTFTAELALNTLPTEELTGGGPLPEGGYTAFAACDLGNQGENGYAISEPQAITVSGTNPSGDWAIAAHPHMITAMGSGCTGGQPVTVTFTGYSFDEGTIIEGLRHDTSRALARRSVPALAKIAPDPDGRFTETKTVTPEADGTWMVETEAPAGSYQLSASADCGDPTATGFRYVTRYLFEDHRADLYIDRASPTSSPVGGEVRVQVGGFCEGDTSVVLTDRGGKVLAESGSIELNQYQMGAGTLKAPSTVGRYALAGRCDDELAYPEPYDVFTPKTVSAAAPLPAEPTEGWPTQGRRQTYDGKIGPITLPAMDMGDEPMAKGTKALGPSGLFIPVPRPTGDFAITKMTFDLVDAEGMPIDQEHAHLHHFVIANTSKRNPACPGGTFGLPGQIVGASGAERTVLQTADPYGLVVKATDKWTGVYELMSRSMEDQTVYLSYDITYRRDVQNVRPVTTYFGSATGCGTFTWTLDGSGTPDEQAHYLTIAKSGRLIGAGGHIHNGGLYADWTNDRGRRLCRSEITYGTAEVGHGMDMTRSRSDRMDEATTTMVVDPDTPVEDEYPPEFYDDDKVIDGINGCPLNESVTAGERLMFAATYDNQRARSGVMGIYTAYVWEGGGPADPPGSGGDGADPIPNGNPNYTG